MKTMRLLGVLLACGCAMAGGALAAGQAVAPTAGEIAAKPELIVAAIQDQTASNSAAIVTAALNAVSLSELSEATKRERIIAIIAYAVSSKGSAAAPMMGLVAAHVSPVWLPVVAATAVVAAGNQSAAVASAMQTALAGNATATAALGVAFANPSAVLQTTGNGIVHAITLPAVQLQVPANKPPLPAPLYEGQ